MNRLLISVFPVFLLAGCFAQAPVSSVDASPTARTAPAVADGVWHTVKPGENLFRIAKEHGRDYRDVAAWNQISNPADIKAGQVLRVSPPGQGGTAAPVAASQPVTAQPVVVGAVVEARPLEARPLDERPLAAADTGSAGNDGLLKREPRAGKEPYSEEADARLNRSGTVLAAASTPATTAPAAVAAEPKPAAAPAGPDDIVWGWPSALPPGQGFGQGANKGIDFVGKAGDPVLAAGDGKVLFIPKEDLRGFGKLVIIKHNATYLSAYAHNRKVLVKEGDAVKRGQKIAEMGSTGTDSVKLHFEIRKKGEPVDPALYLPKR